MKKTAVTVAAPLFGADASACPAWASVSKQDGIALPPPLSSLPRAERRAPGSIVVIEAGARTRAATPDAPGAP
ncbi:MAG: hypothetical protein ACRYF6_09245 [Janthinobacterium lividum]